MFIERLTKEQIINFLHTKKEYKGVIDIQILKNPYNIDGETTISLSFRENTKTRFTSNLLNITDVSFFHTACDSIWIKYLYEIFGEEYKHWYKNKLRDYFNSLFNE